MGTYWDLFMSKHANAVVFEWTLAETLNQYTDWLALQPGYAEYMRQRHIDQQQARQEFD